MKSSILKKLKTVAKRHTEISELMSQPDIIKDQNKFRDLSVEYSQIDPIVSLYKKLSTIQNELDASIEMSSDADLEVRSLAEDDAKNLKKDLGGVEQDLQKLLISEDPNDRNNVFLEIRAGTGGNEAAIFAGDLFRMYARYAEQKNWEVEILNQSEGEHGGYREIIAKVTGDRVYSKLKFESGAHRVQRVPETESQGRIHTSAATVAVLPEPEEINNVEIKTDELRIDTFRASGAGGQHVNKTDSAIRITHIPSGVVVECQDDRSQHKNKAKALALLQAKLLDEKRKQQREAETETRRSLVGSGDRSERIRTYNFPQGRVTDHRINLTLYKLEDLTNGNLDVLIQPLTNEHQAELLAQFSD